MHHYLYERLYLSTYKSLSLSTASLVKNLKSSFPFNIEEYIFVKTLAPPRTLNPQIP